MTPQRTEKVMRKLTEMYNLMAQRLGFPKSMWTEACESGEKLTSFLPPLWTPESLWTQPVLEAQDYMTQKEKEETRKQDMRLLSETAFDSIHNPNMWV
jgi:hypothetical protein